MIVNVKVTLVECLGQTKDRRRVSHGSLHDLTEILMIVGCAMIFNVEIFEDVALWAQLKESCMRRFLVLRNGISSHDRFNRLFSILDAKQFETLFWQLAAGLVPSRPLGAKTETMELQYKIGSRHLSADRLANSMHPQWGSKNKRHRMLDVASSDVGATLCRDNAPQNLSSLWKISLNLTRKDAYKGEPSKKGERVACNDDIRRTTSRLKPL
jgi:hypothetical protein